MEGFGWILKFVLFLYLAIAFCCSSEEFDFKRMANKSWISMYKNKRCNNFSLGAFLEDSGEVALYRSKNREETIKVLYPIQDHRKLLFQNEIHILKILNRKFQNDSQELSVENGIVKLIDSCDGDGIWTNVESAERLPGYCSAIVYTYGEPLFPILRRCVQNNDRKMLFWYFSQMANCMYSIQFIGQIYHNNIGPDVFRLTTGGKVVVDNFENAQSVKNARSKSYVAKNDFPIGFKPTMSENAMNARKRISDCQQHSFELTSYYMLHHRLPWQMDAIEYLWNVNMTEAREITLELQQINLEEYYISWYSIHSEILFVIKHYKVSFETMSAKFLHMSKYNSSVLFH